MSIIRNERGQNVLELVLMVVVFAMISVAVTTGLRNMQIVGKLVNGPWDVMRGMITNGVWGTPEKTRSLHPNHIRRHISFKAEKIR